MSQTTVPVTIDARWPGSCGVQATLYLGAFKGVGRVYQQTFIDTFSNLAFAMIHGRRTPIAAADLLRERVMPFFASHGVVLSRIVTDRGMEFCGPRSRHFYESYVSVLGIEHVRTAAGSAQALRICEPFHRSVADEFFRLYFRGNGLRSLDELQSALDAWVDDRNRACPREHGPRTGRSPIGIFLDGTSKTGGEVRGVDAA